MSNKKGGSIIPPTLAEKLTHLFDTELKPMGIVATATIKLMIGSTPVEFNLDAEGGVSHQDVKDFIESAMANGFTVPKAWQPGNDIVGKKGTVVKIFPAEGSKMFVVRANMDDATIFEWKEFSPTAFRLHDRIEVIKNDRGFKTGKLIDDAEGTQEELPL